MSKNDVVETGVDDLIRLIQKKGKMSLPDVSKELGIPPKAIEKWVDFLVEEGKMDVEYKFTTPFISMKKDEKADPKKQKDKSPQDMDDAKNASSDNKNNNSSAEETSKVSSSQDNISEDEQREIVSEDDIPSNDDIGQKINVLLHPENKEVKEEPDEHDTINSLFKKIKESLDKKDIQTAYSFYIQAKKFLASLPNTDENEYLHKRMIEISENFLSIIKEHSQKIDSDSQKIRSLVKEGSAKLGNNDIGSAKNMYSEMIRIYNSVSNLFLEKKKLMYTDVFDFYRSIVLKEHSLLAGVVDASKKEINSMITAIEESIENNDISSAGSIFSKVNQRYNSLPSGFLEEKMEIHTNILKIYQELKISAKVMQLNQQLHKMAGHHAHNSLSPDEINSDEDDLPPQKSGQIEPDDGETNTDSSPRHNIDDLDIPPPPSDAQDDSQNETEDPEKRPQKQEDAPKDSPKISPEFLDTKNINSMLEEAMKLFKKKRYIEAKGVLEDVLEQDPKNTHAPRLLGEINSILKKDPDKTAKSLISYAISSASVGNFDEAKRCLNQVLEIDPDNTEAKKILDSISNHQL